MLTRGLSSCTSSCISCSARAFFYGGPVLLSIWCSHTDSPFGYLKRSKWLCTWGSATYLSPNDPCGYVGDTPDFCATPTLAMPCKVHNPNFCFCFFTPLNSCHGLLVVDLGYATTYNQKWVLGTHSAHLGGSHNFASSKSRVRSRSGGRGVQDPRRIASCPVGGGRGGLAGRSVVYRSPRALN